MLEKINNLLFTLMVAFIISYSSNYPSVGKFLPGINQICHVHFVFCLSLLPFPFFFFLFHAEQLVGFLIP